RQRFESLFLVVYLLIQSSPDLASSVGCACEATIELLDRGLGGFTGLTFVCFRSFPQGSFEVFSKPFNLLYGVVPFRDGIILLRRSLVSVGRSGDLLPVSFCRSVVARHHHRHVRSSHEDPPFL